MEVGFPDVSMVPVTLQPEDQQPLMLEEKQQAPPAQPIIDRLSVGEPVAVRMSAEWASGDGDLANFIRAEAATHEYWLVQLACTLKPGPDSWIEGANLTCYLGRQDGGVDRRPIAMSMTPSRVRDIQPLKKARSLKLSADLTVIKPAIEYDWSSEGSRSSDMVVAYNLQQPAPFWALKQSDSLALEGSFRFAVVVRAERGTAANLKMTLDGQARERRFGLFKFRVPLPPSLREPVPLP